MVAVPGTRAGIVGGRAWHIRRACHLRSVWPPESPGRRVCGGRLGDPHIHPPVAHDSATVAVDSSTSYKDNEIHDARQLWMLSEGDRPQEDRVAVDCDP